MRRYTRNGEKCLWFEPSEIEQMMESELRKAKLMPSLDAPSVNLEKFVERHLKAQLDHYAELDSDVLGLTEFFESKPPRISLNKDLTGTALDGDETKPGIFGRWRATLAHEAGHALLHRDLFEFAVGNLSLFEQRASEPGRGRQLQRCLKRDVKHTAGGDWREVQANKAMAALLMPKSFFQVLARQHIDIAFPGRDTIPAGSEDEVAARVAPLVEVSKQAATIRLRSLGFVSDPRQGRL